MTLTLHVLDEHAVLSVCFTFLYPFSSLWLPSHIQ